MVSPLLVTATTATLHVILIAFVWYIQPWLFYWALTSSSSSSLLSSRWRFGAALIAFATVSGFLGWQLHQPETFFRQAKVKPIVFLLLFYPLAMQFMRYLHGLAVGGPAMVRHFGLGDPAEQSKDKAAKSLPISFSRLCIFVWCPPTVFFVSSFSDDDSIGEKLKDRLSPKQSRNEWKHQFTGVLMDTMILLAVCAIVILLQLDEWLPKLMQRFLRVYIMGFSTALLKGALECPCHYLLRDHPHVRRILPIYNHPYLTTSPRELWHRWSVTAGYHLRNAFYDKTLATKYGYAGLLVATATPFFVNCILHITWWSLVIKGELDYGYWKLLFIYPLTSFWIQDVVLGTWIFANPSGRLRMTKLHHALNLLCLWTGFLWIVDDMASAHGLASSLGQAARNNLGLKIAL